MQQATLDTADVLQELVECADQAIVITRLGGAKPIISVYASDPAIAEQGLNIANVLNISDGRVTHYLRNLSQASFGIDDWKFVLATVSSIVEAMEEAGNETE